MTSHSDTCVSETFPTSSFARFDESNLVEAVAWLKQGKLLALPTETVYGLAGWVASPLALERIFELKGRPKGHPLIVHLADAVDWHQFATLPSPFQEAVERVMQAFWPGPLTLILPKRTDTVSDAVTGGKASVGLRVPNHPLALALLRTFKTLTGRPQGLAAPSANRFGRISPTHPHHVADEFYTQPEALSLLGLLASQRLWQEPLNNPSTAASVCDVGVESTILDCSVFTPTGDWQPTLRRTGWITSQQLEACLQYPVVTLSQRLAVAEAEASLSAGSLAQHYAPSVPSFLIQEPQAWLRLPAWLHKTLASETTTTPQSSPVACVVFGHPSPEEAEALGRVLPVTCRHVEVLGDASQVSHALYATLRQLDADASIQALVLYVPQAQQNEEPLAWAAVNDRLSRACVVV